MIIAVHRRGVVAHKKAMGILNRHTISTPRQYIRISPIFIREFPFNPFYTITKLPFNKIFYVDKVYITINNHFMNKKYIESSLMLTKEAFIEAALRQQQTEAAQYGLTLDEWRNSILSGSVVQAKSPSDI